MKKFARLTALLLACVMLTGLFCGCEPKEKEPELIDQVADADVEKLDGYDLLWHDEFNGTALDETAWSMELREPGWTNNELQEYTSSTDNVFVRDGKLVLKAIKTDNNGKDYYTSGKVNSQNKKDFMYGKVVASAKVPEGQGLWPAIWMMPTDESYYGQWPKCGEIDIMEVLGSDTSLAYATLHYGEPHGQQQGTLQLEDDKFSNGFHTYSLEWEPGEMRWYIDEQLVLTANDWFTAVSGQDEKPYPAPFDQTFFVQMNLAVGGDWPGNPDSTTDFDKAEFEIDYVRVYQKPEYDTNVSKPVPVFRDPQPDGNLIYNGDFSVAEDLEDEQDWKFLLFYGGEGSAEIRDNMIVIKSQAEGTEDYSVQLVQPDLGLYQGHRYRVTFEARAEEERKMKVCVSAPNVNWIRYLPDTMVELTTDWQAYEYEFNMGSNKDDNYGRFELNMGKRKSVAEINVRNVRIEDITEDTPEAE